MSATWTFRSAHVPDAEFTPLPVMAVRFGPTLDENNATRAGRSFVLPVWIQRQARAAPAQVRDLALDVSYDDGVTWLPAEVARTGNTGLAVLQHPIDASFVSLRVAASDSAGNSVRQTILRAYRLRR